MKMNLSKSNKHDKKLLNASFFMSKINLTQNFKLNLKSLSKNKLVIIQKGNKSKKVV